MKEEQGNNFDWIGMAESAILMYFNPLFVLWDTPQSIKNLMLVLAKTFIAIAVIAAAAAIVSATYGIVLNSSNVYEQLFYISPDTLYYLGDILFVILFGFFGISILSFFVRAIHLIVRVYVGMISWIAVFSILVFVLFRVAKFLFI